MTEEEWEAKFKPLKNHLNPEASWSGHLFETYGPEYDFVDHFDPRRIWTWVDGDDGGTYLVAGRSFVNRIGFLLTEEPWSDEEWTTSITINEPDDEEDE